METVFIPRCRLHRAPDIALSRGDVLALEPHPRQRLMVIGQRRIRRFIAPRRPLADDDADVEFVEGEHALPLLVVVQEQDEVGEQRLDAALVVELQVISPVIRRLLPALLAAATPQLDLAVDLQIEEAVLDDPLKATLPDAYEHVRLAPAHRMKRVADGHFHPGVVHVDGDLAQIRDRTGRFRV